jgi:hypothetical protein
MDGETCLIVPIICKEVLPTAKQVRFTFIAWRDYVFNDLTHGSLDLALIGDESAMYLRL